MTQRFPLAPTKRLADVTLGKMVQPKQSAQGEVAAPYLRAAHVQPSGRVIDLPDQPMWFSRRELAGLRLLRGDVVIVEGGAGFGRSAVLGEDRLGWGFQNSIIRVRARSRVASGRFLDYAFQSALADGSIALVSSTATIPHFTAEKVARFEVPAPPLDEQRVIADYLDEQTAKIDTLIAKQNEMIGLLGVRRRAAVDAAFDGTDAARIRLKFLFRPSGVANHASETVLSVYRDYGVIPKASRDDNFNKTPENVERYLLALPGDLVVNRMKAWQGSLGVSGHRGIVSGDYEVLNPTTQSLDSGYAHHCLRTRPMIEQYGLRSTGIRPSQWRLYWDQMGDIAIPVPPIEEQRAIATSIAAKTASIDALIAKTREHVALAKERRSALITAAVTGQIDVRTATRGVA